MTFGAVFAHPVLFRLSAGAPRYRPVVWRAVHAIDRLVTWGMLVILAAGIYLATDGTTGASRGSGSPSGRSW